jgi:hypothetical protein
MRIRSFTAGRALCLLALSARLVGQVKPSVTPDISTKLMNSTFEIFGNGEKPGFTTSGAVFLIGKPMKDKPGQSWFVLVTAAHVLNEMSGDTATLMFRKKDASGNFIAEPTTIQIRHEGQNSYVQNPDADVAAMFINTPADSVTEALSLTQLATDEILDNLALHPGDELFCLGFPLRVDVNTFPVLRTGTLASYPITPSKSVKKYAFAFHVFPGNSGGPVYFSYANRAYGGAVHGGELDQAVVGLVIEELSSTLPEYKNERLDLANVVPSSYIRDTIALLPGAPPS